MIVKRDNTAEEILAAVAKEYGITIADIKGGCRRKPKPDARKMCCFIMDANGITHMEIAFAISMDRGNVTTAIRQMQDWIRIYPDLLTHYTNIIERL